MLKMLNMPASEMTNEAKTFVKETCDGIVLWAPQWGKIEPHRGQVDGSQWAALDENVTWAHGMLETFIAVPSALPSWLSEWSTGTITLWSRYLARIMQRYPHTTLVVQNEPDHAGISPALCARLMRVASRVAADCHHKRILGPAAATIYYSLNVLWQLRGFKPPKGVQVGFAFHDYIGVGKGQTWRLSALLAAMRASRWQDGQHLWLTELGYIFKTIGTPGAEYPVDPGNWRYEEPLLTQERHQRENVLKHYRWAKRSGKVGMWANYEYVDSLWGGWASGMIAHDGQRHPLHDEWKKL